MGGKLALGVSRQPSAVSREPMRLGGHTTDPTKIKGSELRSQESRRDCAIEILLVTDG
jgi:hypothetical protein